MRKREYINQIRSSSMTDKEKIKAEIERRIAELPPQDLHTTVGAESIRNKSMLDSILHFIDSLPEEPVSNPTPNERMSKERFAEACKAACSDRNYRSHYGHTETRDDYFVDGVQWADEHPIEEPVSEDLEEAARKYGDELDNVLAVVVDDDNTVGEYASEAFKAGAQWQHKQLEKNRLAACDRQTKEEAEREQDFCDKIIIGEQRWPTFSDAIEYGAKWQKQQTINKACDWLHRNIDSSMWLMNFRKHMEG